MKRTFKTLCLFLSAFFLLTGCSSDDESGIEPKDVIDQGEYSEKYNLTFFDQPPYVFNMQSEKNELSSSLLNDLTPLTQPLYDLLVVPNDDEGRDIIKKLTDETDSIYGKMFVNSEEDKLVFFNMNNIEICENISKVQEQVINTYDRLYDAITEDYLNTEAMIEGLETLKNLQDTYNKLQKNLNNTNNILNELQAGKSTVKTMFKKKEKEISKLSTEKEDLEKNINNLGEIIKIATFNMQNTIENFKTISLDNYYAELFRIEGDTEKNGTIFDDLWETVVKDKNISEFN